MKRTAIAVATLALLFGCQQQHGASVTQQKTAEVRSEMTPEQLGELGAQIKKDPSHAHELLSSHGLDDQSFEKAIRKITEDPVASKRYAAAYKNASS